MNYEKILFLKNYWKEKFFKLHELTKPKVIYTTKEKSKTFWKKYKIAKFNFEKYLNIFYTYKSKIKGVFYGRKTTNE